MRMTFSSPPGKRVNFAQRRHRKGLIPSLPESRASPGVQLILQTLIADKNARILSGGTAGYIRPIDPAATGKYYLQCYGRSCDGAVIQLTTASAKPLTMTLVGSRRGLPATAHALLDQRPRFARPQYSPDSTLTISRIRL